MKINASNILSKRLANSENVFESEYSIDINGQITQGKNASQFPQLVINNNNSNSNITGDQNQVATVSGNNNAISQEQEIETVFNEKYGDFLIAFRDALSFKNINEYNKLEIYRLKQQFENVADKTVAEKKNFFTRLVSWARVSSEVIQGAESLFSLITSSSTSL